LEKNGISTVTIVTTAFEELLKSAIKYQGLSEMTYVVVEHPIAGHNLKGVQKLAETAFPEIIKAATKWQPSKK
jgi:hypothetical protein